MWHYTPRQINGFLKFAARRVAREAAEQMAIGAMAARGDQRELNRKIKELTK